MTMVKIDNERALPVPALDPTLPGTLAYLRWHKDDSPAASVRYEARFITHAFLHPHEVTDREVGAESASTRASARRLQSAGHLHEPQARTLMNDEGLSKVRGDIVS